VLERGLAEPTRSVNASRPRHRRRRRRVHDDDDDHVDVNAFSRSPYDPARGDEAGDEPVDLANKR
jgi:hypothetical protein